MNRLPIFIPIIFIVLIVISFILFILIAKSNNSLLSSEKMYFKNHFSFEYFYSPTSVTKYLRIILIFISTLLIASSCLFVGIFKIDNLNTFVFALVISMFFIFAIINSFFTFVIKTNYLSMFKIYVTLTFLLNAMSNCILGILLMNSMFENVSYKIIGGLLFVNVLFNFILMLNPKLKDWDKLEEKINANNEKIYVRPKFMYLPISMWISYITLLIGSIYSLLVVTLVSAGI